MKYSWEVKINNTAVGAFKIFDEAVEYIHFKTQSTALFKDIMKSGGVVSINYIGE